MIAASFLPETLKQRLPESLEDADKFGEGNKFWSISVRKDSSYLKQASLMRRQSLATNRNMANHVDNGKKWMQDFFICSINNNSIFNILVK